MAGAYQDTVISMDQPLREPKKDAVESVTFVPEMFEGAFPGASKEQKKEQAKYLTYMVNVRNVPVNHAVGILANIYRESGFDPSLTSKRESSYGLLQWNDSDDGEWNRGTRMKDFVNKGRGKDADGKEPWETDWRGQLDYAIQEVEEGSNKRFHDMYLGDDSITDAYTASDWLVNRNIRPGGVDKEGKPDEARRMELKLRRDYIDRFMSSAKGYSARESKNAIFKLYNPLAGGRNMAY